ncbi:MAG: glycosyltransferase family 2 protein [Patescibacteria group bacterium]
MGNIDLSVITVSHNIKKMLKECLGSVYKKGGDILLEVFVYDQSSTDGSAEMVSKNFPQVILLRDRKNIGFGSSNNVAMKKARGRYVLLLNPDTKIIQKNIFKEMIDWMDKNPKVGITSCALVNPNKTLQGSGGYFPTLFRVLAWMFFLDDIPIIDRLIKPYHPLHAWSPIYKGENYFKRTRKQDWVTGAFFLIRKEVINDIGYFDKDYFAYVEEVDYCYRAAKSGWEVWYLPKWKTIHYGQVTAGSEFALVNEMKNLKLFYKKHYPSWKLPILTLLIKAGTLLRMGVFGLLKGSEVAKTYAKAFRQT